jgi:hypothetical protein
LLDVGDRLGDTDGVDDEGDSDGRLVVGEIVGLEVGDVDGDVVGAPIVGPTVGVSVGDVDGAEIVGPSDGEIVGERVGATVGDTVGSFEVGVMVGDVVGNIVGDFVGEQVTPCSQQDLIQISGSSQHICSFWFWAMMPGQKSNSSAATSVQSKDVLVGFAVVGMLDMGDAVGLCVDGL